MKYFLNLRAESCYHCHKRHLGDCYGIWCTCEYRHDGIPDKQVAIDTANLHLRVNPSHLIRVKESGHLVWQSPAPEYPTSYRWLDD